MVFVLRVKPRNHIETPVRVSMLFQLCEHIAFCVKACATNHLQETAEPCFLGFFQGRPCRGERRKGLCGGKMILSTYLFVSFRNGHLPFEGQKEAKAF